MLKKMDCREDKKRWQQFESNDCWRKRCSLGSKYVLLELSSAEVAVVKVSFVVYESGIISIEGLPNCPVERA
jgi:hypothetical protein